LKLKAIELEESDTSEGSHPGKHKTAISTSTLDENLKMNLLYAPVFMKCRRRLSF
ncbi:unnamed protein product, partial [Ceratitis capitata]